MKIILAPVDFSAATPPVLKSAAQLARAFQAKVVIVHVIRPTVIANTFSPEVAELQMEAQNDESKQSLYWERTLQNEGVAVEISEPYGDPATCIHEEAKRLGADLIVIGSHGHGAIYDLLIGSTAARLLKKSPCPVLVVPISDPSPAKFADEVATETAAPIRSTD